MSAAVCFCGPPPPDPAAMAAMAPWVTGVAAVVAGAWFVVGAALLGSRWGTSELIDSPMQRRLSALTLLAAMATTFVGGLAVVATVYAAAYGRWWVTTITGHTWAVVAVATTGVALVGAAVFTATYQAAAASDPRRRLHRQESQ